MITIKQSAPNSDEYFIEETGEKTHFAHKCYGTEDKYFVQKTFMCVRKEFEIYDSKNYLFTVLAQSKDQLIEHKDTDDLFLVFYNKHSNSPRYGVLNKNFDIVIPAVLEYAEIICQKFIKYSINGNYGLYDDQLNNIISPEFESVKQVENFFLTAKKGKFPNIFWDYWEDCWSSSFYKKEDGDVLMEGCQIFNNEGHLSYNETFDNIYIYFEHCLVQVGRSAVKENQSAEIGLCIVKKSENISYGILNRKGNFQIPPIYEHLDIITEPRSNGVDKPIAIKYGTNVKYDFDGLGMNDTPRYRYQGGSWGLLSLSGEIIIPAHYDEIIVCENFVKVRKSNKFGLYDISGKLILDTIYSSICILKNNKRIEFILCNLDGECILEPDDIDKHSKYLDALGSFYKIDGKQVIEGGKWGFYNLRTNKVSGLIYSGAGKFNKGKALVIIENEFFYINEDFEVVSRPFESRELAEMYFYDCK